MKEYCLKFTSEADYHLETHIKAGNKQLLKKIYSIFNELKEHPYTGTGKPKPLKGKYKGFWSRRINIKHRLVYIIEETQITVLVISVLGHYNDK